MEERDTEYTWLRFIAGLHIVLGTLSLLAGAGGLAFVALSLLHVSQVSLDVWVWGLWSVVFLLSGVVTIGFGQGIRALADIADNSRLIPLILDRMTRRRREVDDLEPPLVPELGTPPSLERACPKCGASVPSSHPVCPDCGTRVRSSRPA